MRFFFISFLFLLQNCKKSEPSNITQCTGSFVAKNGTNYIRTSSKHNSLEPELILRLFNEPINTTAALSGTYYHQVLKTNNFWPHSQGENIVVAVIDTGVNFNHKDLQNSLWVNTGEIPGNNIDDDQNGYVDDVHGFNFVSGNGNSMDDNGHGTHVSGVIAGGNGLGIAPKAKIMAIKTMDSQGGGNLTDALNGIEYAIKMGANVINASWGTSAYSSELRVSIQKAYGHGIVFVAAAGNETRNNDDAGAFPASYSVPSVVSVASTSHQSNLQFSLSYFSNYGFKTVPVAMPGSSIQSSWIGGNTYRNLSGTSMASPMMAGLIALTASYKQTSSALSWISHTLCTTKNSTLPTSFGCVSSTDTMMETMINNTKKVVTPVYQRVGSGETISLEVPPSGYYYEVVEGNGSLSGNKLNMTTGYAKVVMKSNSNTFTNSTLGTYYAGNPEPHQAVECE